MAEIQLRGHHVLCLLGYRGMGYSDEYVQNMTQAHEKLRAEPQTLVRLVLGPDSLCSCFPKGQPYHCEDGNVYERDAQILSALGLNVDTAYPWAEIEVRIAARLFPADIPRFCSTCPWLSYGVCESGVLAVIDGHGLRPLPSAVNPETETESRRAP